MRIAFTDRELDVMSVLWDLGDATVAEVRERLADKLAYTTVLTVLRTLEHKGTSSTAGEGRAHRYHTAGPARGSRPQRATPARRQSVSGARRALDDPSRFATRV